MSFPWRDIVDILAVAFIVYNLLLRNVPVAPGRSATLRVNRRGELVELGSESLEGIGPDWLASQAPQRGHQLPLWKVADFSQASGSPATGASLV